MMYISRIFISLALLVCYIDTANAGGDWSFVKPWIGKYPSASVDGTKGGLLAQPEIRDSIKRILPNSDISTIARLTTDAPVSETEEFVVVNKCRPHNCPSDMAMVVIDVKNKRLWVGLFSRDAHRVITRWYGTSDDYSVLPESIKKEFLSRHGD